MAKFWISRYALTCGIIEFEGEVSNISTTMITGKREGGYLENFHGNDWHNTREKAVKRAEQMRDSKVKSLRGQITKFEKMTF